MSAIRITALIIAFYWKCKPQFFINDLEKHMTSFHDFISRIYFLWFLKASF